MSKKTVLVLCIVMGTSNLIGGCITEKTDVKKIVLEENILDKQDKENQDKKNQEEKEYSKEKYIGDIKESYVGVEVLDLNLKEGEYFLPSFQQNGEIYGYITNGYLGMVEHRTSTEEYPIKGQYKEYLYKLGNDNVLEESDKEMVTSGVYTSYFYGRNEKNKENDLEILKLDYKNSDVPIEVPELNKVAEKLRDEQKLLQVNLRIVDIKDEEWFSFMYPRNCKGFLYNLNEDKLYSTDEEIDGYKSSIMYDESLGGFICIEDGLNIKKVILEGNKFYFEDYLDIGKVINIDNLSLFRWSGDEIIIKEESYYKKDGKYTYHPFKETLSLLKYNLKTNQVTTLFEKPEGVNIYARYLGNDLILIEEFKEDPNDDDYILSQKRYFYKIEGHTIKKIFEENTEEEGKTIYPQHIDIEVSEDGKEIFIAKRVSAWEIDVDETVDMIYKRYTLE